MEIRHPPNTLRKSFLHFRWWVRPYGQGLIRIRGPCKVELSTAPVLMPSFEGPYYAESSITVLKKKKKLMIPRGYLPIK
jgi:hypothetical protein